MVADYIMMSKTTHNPDHHGPFRLVGNTGINPKITLQNVQLQQSQRGKREMYKVSSGYNWCI